MFYQNSQISHTDVFKPNWYIEQFKGWTRLSYTVLGIGYIIITLTTFLNFKHGVAFVPLTTQNALTWVAAVLGFTCTLAITNAKPMNGMLGLTSALIYIFVALTANNPSDAVLQGFYILVLDLPVLIMPSWAKDVEKHLRFIHETKMRGEKFSPMFWYVTVSAVAVGAFIFAYLFETHVTHSPRPVSDAFVLGTGMAGAVLTGLRFSESGVVWLIQGVAQIILWGHTAIHGDANWVPFVTYIMYVMNDLLIIFQSKWFHHQEFNKPLTSE